MDNDKALILQGVKLLVVDDDLDSLALLTYVLELHGVEVFAVTSVQAAKTAFVEVRPQLVISDLAMPTETGYDFIRWLQSLQLESGGQVPTLVLTALAHEAERQQALAAGFSFYLSKPVDVDALLQVLLTLLHPSRSV